MTTEDFEKLIQGAEESAFLDFKAPMDWSVKCFVKDILAMSNLIDGGSLVVGVEDATYARLGVTNEQIRTYDTDIMKDQVAPFADPAVSFSRYVVVGTEGKNFVVIQVRPFDQELVICRKSGHDVHAG